MKALQKTVLKKSVAAAPFAIRSERSSDAAAREAVASIVNPDVRVIDASSAHRTTPGWTYGFPEMSAGQAQRVATASRVTNPGCYPTGAIALLRPLVQPGLVPPVGGVVLPWPYAGDPGEATINGEAAEWVNKELHVHQLPARVEIDVPSAVRRAERKGQ